MRTTRILAAAALVAGCKCSPKPENGAPELPAGPFQTVPPTDATLSILVADGPTCVWSRFDPIAQKSAAVARAKGPCGQVAWSHDGKRGLLAVRHADVKEGQAPLREEDMPYDVYEADFADGSTRLLGQVPETMKTLGFDPQGHVLALTLDVPELPEGEEAPKELTYEGKSYPIPEELEGVPAFAHALVAEGGRFRHQQTAVVGAGSDYAEETRGLAEERHLGPRLSEMEANPEGEDVEDPALTARLGAACPERTEEGVFVKLKTPAPLYLYEETGEFYTPTLCLVTDDGTSATALPEANAGSTTAEASMRGSYLLLFEQGRRFARLYHTREKRLVGTARGDVVTFWPAIEPAAPAPAPAQK